MKTKPWIAMLLLASVGLSSAGQNAQHQVHWGYSGEAGPEHWSELESDFGVCNSGRDQSPIDLSNFIEADLPSITFNYKPGGFQMVNNGHAIEVDYNPGSSITVDSTVFELKQFHFHSPSENTIDGKSFPMEAHFVHADAKGNLAVVALMFEDGNNNKLLEELWPHVPQVVNGREALTPEISAGDLLPTDRDYYRYSGSLTTPPCSEGVRWFVLKHPAKASAEQVSVVGKAIGHPNNRPVQLVGARPVLE